MGFKAVLDALPPEDSDREGQAKRGLAMTNYRKAREALDKKKYGNKFPLRPRGGEVKRESQNFLMFRTPSAEG